MKGFLPWPLLIMALLLFSCSSVVAQDASAEITTPRENLSRLGKDPSAEGNPERCDIRLVGKIGPGTAKKFKSIFGNEEIDNEFNAHATTLCLDSTGGVADEALEIARFIITQHSESISTVVQNDAVCQSACALIFLAGREKSRLGPSVGRYLQPRGRLKLHPTFLRNDSDDSLDRYLKGESTRDQLLATFYARGLHDVQQIIATYDETTWFADYVGRPFASASLFLEIFSQAPDEWLCMDTIDKLGRWDIRLVGYERTSIPKEKYYNVCRNAYIWGHDEYAANNSHDNIPGRVNRTSPKKTIAGRNVGSDDGFDARYVVKVDFAVKAQKCVVEEKKWDPFSTMKVYFLSADDDLVSGIFETNDAGYFAPDTPVAELSMSPAEASKQDQPLAPNPALPHFLKRQERAMACELRRFHADDIDACEAYCAHNRECVGFSYSKSSGACSLKHTSSALRYDPLWETGIRPGIQIPQESIRNKVMDTNTNLSDYGFVLKGNELDKSSKESFNECTDYCLGEEKCRGVIFNAERNLCQRLETIEGVSDAASDHLHDSSGAVETTEIAIKRQK